MPSTLPGLAALPRPTMMTSVDMFLLDENSESLGVSKAQLMENAGAAVARVVLETGASTVVLCCGLGNNGGDGFVVARHLACEGKAVTVILAGDPARISTPEARLNWNIVSRMHGSIHVIEARDSSDVTRIPAVTEGGAIIDGLLGSGASGGLREPVAALVRWINQTRKATNVPVIAIDVPTGMNMDTGMTMNEHVVASATVTFHLPKTGMTGREHVTGTVLVRPIGIPPEAAWLVGQGDVKLLFKQQRDVRSTKGMNGKVLVIGGSAQYSGAPALAALAAARCGVDLVIACVPAGVAPVVKTFSPDLIVSAVPGQDWFASSDVAAIEARLAWADAVLLGPGAGNNDETLEFFQIVAAKAVQKGKAVIIDADAIRAVATELEIVDTDRVVLTPHGAEFGLLTGKNLGTSDFFPERLARVTRFAADHAFTVMLKGPEDIIASTGRCKVNLEGTPAMTVGGTGDVLAGITTAFACRHDTTPGGMFLASCAATRVNGLAGQIVEARAGGSFILASQLIDTIPEAIRRHVAPGT